MREIIEEFSALNYLIDFYFPKYKLVVEVDELVHADRDLVKENKRQTEIAEYLNCKCITIDPDKKDFSTYDELGEIYKFFDEFKKRQIKNLEKENEELRTENEEFKKEKKRKEKENKMKELEDEIKKLKL